jgi:hypothetical protein
MYSIDKQPDHLLVKFKEDLDFNVVQAVIHHLMLMKEYADTNDIWLIGTHHAHIRLGEIETMVREFQCHCPKDGTRSRTAIVVNQGLTYAIVELWAKALQRRVSFDIQLFETLPEAEGWVAADKAEVA